MSWTILAMIGVFMWWSGALSRRRPKQVESQMADLTEAYHRLEADMATRVTELEERLDFTERLLAEQRQRVHLGRSP